MADEFVQVTTTVATFDDAERIALALVEKRLAACTQIVGPITSVYRWKGQVETASEYLCLVKTRRSLYSAVEAAIREMHPYELPEITETLITGGSDGYLSWIAAETLS